MRDIKGMIDISGMGGPYEGACQVMLQKGYEWLEKKKAENKDVDLKVTTYKNVYGILNPESDDAKALSKAITDNIPGGVSGAMHQAVMGHLIYIANHGVDEWKEYVETARAKRE